MGVTSSFDGQDLRLMFGAATRWLERNANYINSLNVFPVPDGDTGTNMLLTIRAAMEEAARSGDSSASTVSQAMAKGSLMGARGNSGVILSQILRGLARSFEGKDRVSSRDLAGALSDSSDYAYKGMTKPVEGTILTVIREVAERAKKSADDRPDDIMSTMEEIVEQARSSVQKTPSLLPVLRQAGVVDAGGQGLYVILQGALRHLQGESMPEETAEEAVGVQATETVAGGYGYCTEFLLEGSNINLEAIRNKLDSIGDSVLVVGDENRARAHVHTHDPGAALSYATSLGVLRQVKVDNMDDQHREFVIAKPDMTSTTISIVTVAHGQGLIQVLYSIGATRVVPGGDTMNPSVQELLQAVESLPARQVLLLPNNPNILLTALQVATLTSKEVEIVPSKTIPQGVTALLAFNPDADLKSNALHMEKALSSIHSGEVTRAVRTMSLDGYSITKGQAIAFLDGELVAANRNMPQVVLKMLSKVDLEQGGLVTIYYGANSAREEAEQLAESIRVKYPAQEVEVISGGQPHYDYIVSME